MNIFDGNDTPLTRVYRSGNLKEDNTHFCAYGATRMCDLAVDEIQHAAPDLAKQLNRGQ